MDACRFCWMCRHICPIGNATGQERNTARARALTLSLVKRDAAKLDGDIVDNLYECALCGGCTNDCATGWDPVSLTKDARLAAAINGQLPSYVEKLLDNHDKTGNIYGRTCKDSILSDIIKTLPGKADILLFLGADAVYHTPAKAIEAIDLLKKSGTVFTVFDDEPDSGYSYDFLIGSAEETRSMMAATADKLNGTGALKIICYDPADAKVFRHEYKEYGIRLNAEIITYPAFIKSLISDNILQIKKSETVFTFQDPALLARDLEDTESARYVLDACGNRREMLQCGKGTMLGGNLIMNEYLPNVMKLVADNRIANALHVSAENLVTASPAEYLLLRAAAGDKINVITLEEAVLSCL
ncbi:MAG: (Fe-S)-binding protein [Clostridia bacterium]|nr:(Fe-S)-binding protein [Clostridia bacterium]